MGRVGRAGFPPEFAAQSKAKVVESFMWQVPLGRDMPPHGPDFQRLYRNCEEGKETGRRKTSSGRKHMR
jgi:hypothetical protein